jgi:hypothetical protein
MARPPVGEIKAVADVLASEDNADMTAEEIAEGVIHALDEERGKKKRLAVVAVYRWTEDDPREMCVLGPFSTRGLSAARAVGERMAGSLQGGQGKWMTVPAYASAKDAWDAIKPPSRADQALAEATESIRRSLGEQAGQPQAVYDRWLMGRGPTCVCGMKHNPYCFIHKRRAGDARAA